MPPSTAAHHFTPVCFYWLIYCSRTLTIKRRTSYRHTEKHPNCPFKTGREQRSNQGEQEQSRPSEIKPSRSSSSKETSLIKLLFVWLVLTPWWVSFTNMFFRPQMSFKQRKPAGVCETAPQCFLLLLFLQPPNLITTDNIFIHIYLYILIKVM